MPRRLSFTQSVALEMAPHNIRCNAICPGNLLDSPLWTHPDKGLFVQYLRAGKVPGAKSIDDVRQVGTTLFSTHNLPLQVVGVLILVATIGVVILSKRELK